MKFNSQPAPWSAELGVSPGAVPPPPKIRGPNVDAPYPFDPDAPPSKE